METSTPEWREIMRLWGIIQKLQGEEPVSKPKNDSFVPDAMFAGLPPTHPAREQQGLTVMQQFAYPVLLWFFDTQRNRATGRSYLMARVLIELAMRGEKVVVEDLSAPEGFRTRVAHFRDLVMRVLHDEYPKHLFNYRQTENTLTYEGRRP